MTEVVEVGVVLHLRQAIEHCDQTLRLAEFLMEQPDHPLVGKAYQRRATAHCMLSNFKLAAADFERALQKDPTSKEVGATRFDHASAVHAPSTHARLLGLSAQAALSVKWPDIAVVSPHASLPLMAHHPQLSKGRGLGHV